MSKWSWGFHSLRGCIYPGGRCFHLLCVSETQDGVWQARSGVGVSSSYGAESTRGTTALWMEWKIYQRIHYTGLGPILPEGGDIVGFSRGAVPAARASPPDWPRPGGGWENAVMEVICLLYYKRENRCASRA